MNPSKVYYSDMHATGQMNLLKKLERLIMAAGIDSMPFDKGFTALKIHFGEYGNLAYLRPNWAKVIVDKVKSLDGRIFVTDANTLYVGRRKNALDHLEIAYENGYNPFSVGCHVIIADGLKGTDEALVPVDGEYIKEAKIGRAVMDADMIISVNHFKGHEATGFGGAIKNIGMGCGSRAGKMEMHSSGKPFVSSKSCETCGACIKICAHDAITITTKNDKRTAAIDHEKCVGCGRCIGVCHFDAVKPPFDESFDILNRKIAEYTLAVLKDRPHFHVSFVIDVSPNCDCHTENDIPVIPNVGMFASFDPVALDMACADMAMKQPIMPGSLNDKKKDEKFCHCEEKFDHFGFAHPETNWMSALEHAEKLGIGTREYELIKV